MLRIYLLGVLIVVFVFATIIAFAQDQHFSFGDKVGFVVILECSVNDEVIASIAQQVINEEPTEMFKVATAFSPGAEYFNSADLTKVSIYDLFTEICLKGLTGGKVTRMKE